MSQWSMQLVECIKCGKQWIVAMPDGKGMIRCPLCHWESSLDNGLDLAAQHAAERFGKEIWSWVPDDEWIRTDDLDDVV